MRSIVYNCSTHVILTYAVTVSERLTISWINKSLQNDFSVLEDLLVGDVADDGG